MMATPRQRGVSLIEALVALAVMAFGMLGIAGIQATLRNNADVARQRAEAVRIGSQFIEQARAYSVVHADPGRPDSRAYDDIRNQEAIVPGTNATYTLNARVADVENFRQRIIRVRVTWQDRRDTPQEVELAATIHRTPPELAMSLMVSGEGTATSIPEGRNSTIPSEARDNNDGTSQFTPPGQSGGSTVTWRFNNATGMITNLCSTSGCTGRGYLLQGYIFFATSADPATPANSEAPPDNALPDISIKASQLMATSPPTWKDTTAGCYFERLPRTGSARTVVYYCAMAGATSGASTWSGYTEVTANGLLIGAPSPAPTPDPEAPAPPAPDVRVCRYTPHQGLVKGNTSYTDANGGVHTVFNEDHPYYYVKVDRNLVNQNFLIVRSTSTCPGDNPGTPLVNGSTWEHPQPVPQVALP
jgi:Tfp pilus assembly protein PilV